MPDRRIGEAALQDLLARMMDEEKVAQLVQLGEMFFDGDPGAITGPLGDFRIRPETVSACGSVLGSTGAARLRRLQEAHLAQSRLPVPLLFMTDVIHGLRTIFPIPLALGCSFDPSVAERVARVSAVEATAAGLHVTFSPMCDFVRDPRWGRVMESGGECAWLDGLLAAAMVRGYQGDDLSDPSSLAACAKHFVGYGAVEAGREYHVTDVSERTLRERHLPAFQAAVDAGVALVMPAFTVVDGLPPAASPWLLRTVLRDEMGFEGVTVSDWGAVAELILHGVAEDRTEAARKALAAGVDVEMMSSCYANHLLPLLESGEASRALVDEAVLRILRLKDRLGLFTHPFHGADEEKERAVLLCGAHRAAARDVASRCMVLLKNEGDVLPLSRDAKRVAVIGPLGEVRNLLGGWAADGLETDCATVAEALAARLGADRVDVVEGCGFDDDRLDLERAVAAAKAADAVVLAVGEHSGMSGEAASKAFLGMPGRQLALCAAVLATGVPCAVVLFSGRPLVIPELASMAPAILAAWFPGTEAAEAVADVLLGDREPGGRLSMSFPAAVGQIPVYHDFLPTGRPRTNPDDYFQTGYHDLPNEPLFAFGHGLSYTTFSYWAPAVDRDVLVPGDAAGSRVVVSVDVTNTGRRAGTEVVQLYLRDLVASVSRPVKELKGFERVALAPGETRRVSFRVDEPMLRFLDDRKRVVSEPGRFHAFVGSSSARLSDPVAFTLAPAASGEAAPVRTAGEGVR